MSVPPETTLGSSSVGPIAGLPVGHDLILEAPEGAPLPRPEGVQVNELAFKIGTVNGTGSASANSLLMQALFRMGLPISGKNVFPSNIQGLPTWYEIRVSGRGYTARTPDFDLVVIMNTNTYKQDIAEVRSGGWVLYDSSWPLDEELLRSDVTFLGVPIGDMCVRSFKGGRERVLMKNIFYVGALAALLDMDMDIIRAMIQEKFSKKPKLMDSNYLAIRMGYEYAKEHFDCPLPIRLQSMNENANKIILDGNTGAALGCVYAGATVGSWYPITPATSVMDNFQDFCNRYRTNKETGEKSYVIVQAEDELAAAGVAIGAGWAGARAFTPTSGPGIDLMSEFIGLAYYTEIPAVFFDIQRTGPSTGMPTRTQQGDFLLTAYASHGDTKHIALYPNDPSEAFYLSVEAFDLAERFQTPVFVLSDLDIGMNDWVCDRLTWDDGYRPNRGKVLTAEQLAEAGRKFFRYLDVDGDAVPYRTRPGDHPKGAYFTRGSGHDKYGRYTEDSEAYQEVVDRLKRKLDNAALAVPKPEFLRREGATMGIIGVGSPHRAILESLDRFAANGMPIDYMRLRAFPFGPEVKEFIASHDKVFVVEQNRDAQMRSLLILETQTNPAKLLPVIRYSGLPLSARHVVEEVMKHLRATNGGVSRNGGHA
jgi:2-oxoglutarate/2-oxoacid ferredoxin oxidoreductase subunit alpha